eukprot:scaffold10469_cov118-Isochrysis_galbana.AAC.10
MSHPPGDAIATAVHAQYSRLGPTGKPQGGEWTVLAGILLAGPSGVRVVALGTGTKCLPASSIAADSAGWRLHDSHAEVCARRAFRLFLLAQIRLHSSEVGPAASVLLRLANGAFELRPEWSVHLYTSQPPCGDASIFGQWQAAAAAAEPAESDGQSPAKRPRLGATGAPVEPSQSGGGRCAARATVSVVAWEAAAVPAGTVAGLPAATAGGVGGPAAARPHQLGSRATEADTGKRTGARPAQEADAAAESRLGGAVATPGLLRIKPGRGERTCCMSCSDKLARWGVIGLQGALLSLLLPVPIVFTTITAGQPCSVRALRRALRLPPAPAQAVEVAQGQLCPHAEPLLLESNSDFAGGIGERPSSNSVLWHAGASVVAAESRASPPPPMQEAVNGLSGLRLGANKGSTSPKVRSAACKAAFALAFAQLCAALDDEARALLPPPLRGGRAGPGGGTEGGTAAAAGDIEGGSGTAEVDIEGGNAKAAGCTVGGTAVAAGYTEGGSSTADNVDTEEGTATAASGTDRASSSVVEGATAGDTDTGGGNTAGSTATVAAAGGVQPNSCSDGGAVRGAPRRAAVPADAAGASVRHQALLPRKKTPSAASGAWPAAAEPSLTYRQAKQLSAAYQGRKAALLAHAAFTGWVRAPPECESFAYSLGGA